MDDVSAKVASTRASKGLSIDGQGNVRRDVAAAAEPAAVAASLCEFLGPLLGVELRPLSARAMASSSGLVGLVTIRADEGGSVSFVTGTATEASAAEAVAIAVLRALEVEDGLLVAAGRRWARHPDVTTVTVMTPDTSHLLKGNAHDGDEHWALLGTLSGPGRLSVRTQEGEMLVLGLAEVAISLSIARSSPIIDRVHRWMIDVEARVSEDLC